MSVIPLQDQKNNVTKPSTAETDSRRTAKRVLKTEVEALLSLADFLNDSFDDTVSLIEAAEGRVIVTGMGKSGHVARKIAATLASTGTPAFFVHPAESSHGDLGMIVRGDIVLALSNSGESKELSDLIAYTRRFAIPLVGITSQPLSTLAEKSDIALLLPPFKEACPNNLAPTTSTTVTMALGDALAVTLLERRGFTDKDYQVFHPGGKLGLQLMRVGDIMHTGDAVPVISESALMKDVVEEINIKGFGCTALVDSDGRLSGIIVDGDLRRNILNNIVKKKASEVMTRDPKTVKMDTLVAECMAMMNDVKGTYRKITSLLVVDDDKKPIGLLHIHDCLHAGFAGF